MGTMWYGDKRQLNLSVAGATFVIVDTPFLPLSKTLTESQYYIPSQSEISKLSRTKSNKLYLNQNQLGGSLNNGIRDWACGTFKGF